MSSTLSSATGAVRRFWDRYLEFLRKQGIKPPRDEWYVIRAEAHIKAHPERRLAEQTTRRPPLPLQTWRNRLETGHDIRTVQELLGHSEV